MSAFRFRLARVLGVRRIEEELARAEWLEAERAARAAEELALGLQSAVERARADLEDLQSSSRLDPADVLLKQALVDRLREQWVQRTIQASRSRREAEKLRQAMAERRVRVRGLETLESNARGAWRQENETRANAELDERANLPDRGASHEHEDRARRGTQNQS
jgi:flagellar export protein FliJ